MVGVKVYPHPRIRTPTFLAAGPPESRAEAIWVRHTEESESGEDDGSLETQQRGDQVWTIDEASWSLAHG